MAISVGCLFDCSICGSISALISCLDARRIKQVCHLPKIGILSHSIAMKWWVRLACHCIISVRQAPDTMRKHKNFIWRKTMQCLWWSSAVTSTSNTTARRTYLRWKLIYTRRVTFHLTTVSFFRLLLFFLVLQISIVGNVVAKLYSEQVL